MVNGNITDRIKNTSRKVYYMIKVHEVKWVDSVQEIYISFWNKNNLQAAQGEWRRIKDRSPISGQYNNKLVI